MTVKVEQTGQEKVRPAKKETVDREKRGTELTETRGTVCGGAE